MYAPLKRLDEATLPASPGHAAGHGPVPGGPTAGAVATADSTTSGLPPLFAAAKARLAEAGFDVVVRPKAKHAIDLAAERGEGDIQRVIVRIPERLTAEVAQQVLKASRELDVDLALVVCADAEPAARRAFIATKARWLAPDDLEELHL
jgi:hypothetical protein